MLMECDSAQKILFPWQNIGREAAFDRFLQPPQGLAAATSTWQGPPSLTPHFPRTLGFTSFQDTENNPQKPLKIDTIELFVLGWAVRLHITHEASSRQALVHTFKEARRTWHAVWTQGLILHSPPRMKYFNLMNKGSKDQNRNKTVVVLLSPWDRKKKLRPLFSGHWP